MYIKYRVGLCRKIWKNGRKTTFYGKFRGVVPVPNRVVPVPVPNALFWTNVSILTITWSFLIRFE